MQRKAICGLLLLCALSALAQKRDPNVYQKSKVEAKPSVVEVFGTQGRVGVNIGKKKVPVGQPLPPLPNSGVDYHQAGAPMPPIRLVTAKMEVYTHTTLKNDANMFVMMFNPTCEHCEEMTLAFEKALPMFKQSNIVLMAAPTMMPYLEYFANTTKYTAYPALKVGVDSAGFIDRTFNYITLPQINVYDKDRKLIKSFSGLETIDSLKPYIQ